MYELQFTRAAWRYFKKIRDKKLAALFRDALETIAREPHKGSQKTGDLAGIYCYDVYYNKTNYEIAYRIYSNGKNIVIIILAGTRENFYAVLKHYLS